MAKFNSDESDQNRSDAADDGAHERAPLALPIVKSGGGTSEAADESGTPSEQHGETATPPPPSPHDDDIAVDEARQASPAPSVLTLTPSLRENFYSEEFGRALNSLSGVYKLPADAQEMSRLGKLRSLLL